MILPDSMTSKDDGYRSDMKMHFIVYAVTAYVSIRDDFEANQFHKTLFDVWYRIVRQQRYPWVHLRWMHVGITYATRVEWRSNLVRC